MPNKVNWNVSMLSHETRSESSRRIEKLEKHYKSGPSLIPMQVNFIVPGELVTYTELYGNDNDDVDKIAVEVVENFDKELGKHHIYKNAIRQTS